MFLVFFVKRTSWTYKKSKCPGRKYQHLMDQIDSDLFLLLRIQKTTLQRCDWKHPRSRCWNMLPHYKKDNYFLDVLKLPPCTLTSEVYTYSKPWAPLRKHFSRQACHAGNAMLIPRQTFPEEPVGIKENPKN